VKTNLSVPSQYAKFVPRFSGASRLTISGTSGNGVSAKHGSGQFASTIWEENCHFSEKLYPMGAHRRMVRAHAILIDASSANPSG